MPGVGSMLTGAQGTDHVRGDDHAARLIPRIRRLFTARKPDSDSRRCQGCAPVGKKGQRSVPGSASGRVETGEGGMAAAAAAGSNAPGRGGPGLAAGIESPRARSSNRTSGSLQRGSLRRVLTWLRRDRGADGLSSWTPLHWRSGARKGVIGEGNVRRETPGVVWP
jgi:hypothetical protein